MNHENKALAIESFRDDVTVTLGASAESMKLTKDYLAIVIGCGCGIFTNTHISSLQTTIIIL